MVWKLGFFRLVSSSMPIRYEHGIAIFQTLSQVRDDHRHIEQKKMDLLYSALIVTTFWFKLNI